MRVLYMFGLNEDGQCGVPHRQEHNGRFFPVPVALPLKVSISSVSAGSRHTLALSTSGDVFSWGWGHLGQLGHGEGKSLSQPTKIASLKNIICVSAGGVHSACIDAENYCYTWGSCTYGQLGLGIEVTMTRKCMVMVPTVVTLRSGGDVKGEKYVCFKDSVTESTTTEACESAQEGQSLLPSNALRASKISCGGLHTAAIDLRGSVYCWGKADSGQTGYADWYQAFSAAVCSPRRVEGLGPRGRSNSSVASPFSSPHVAPRKSLLPATSSTTSSTGSVGSEKKDHPALGLRAVDVSCGGFHTMVTLEDGSVFAMGKQDFGMLGTGTEHSYSIDIGAEAPTMVMYHPASAAGATGAEACAAAAAGEGAAAMRALQVSTGGWHTAVVSADGRLFMCGKGEYGRLGLRDEKSRMELTLVPPPQYRAVRSGLNAPLLPTLPEDAAEHAPVAGAASCRLSGALSAGASASDSDGGTGNCAKADAVTCVSAGGSHTLWATAAGRVYAVGRLDGGRLGVGVISQENPQRLQYAPCPTAAAVPEVVVGAAPAGLNKKADRLLGSVDITAFLYTCCAGKEPHCAHRTSLVEALAQQQAVPYSVVQVAAGGSHSAVLLDFPTVTHEGAYEEFLSAVYANILCEEARVDFTQIATVK